MSSRNTDRSNSQQGSRGQQVSRTQQSSRSQQSSRTQQVSRTQTQQVSRTQQSSKPQQTPRNQSTRKNILYNWEFTHDEEGQFIVGILIEDNEQKEWETNYLSKIVLHRQYVEAFTESNSIYIMEYKHAKSGGHTLYL